MASSTAQTAAVSCLPKPCATAALYIAADALKSGVATPLFSASGVVYNAAMAQGFAKQDTAAVCAVLEKLSGIKR